MRVEGTGPGTIDRTGGSGQTEETGKGHHHRRAPKGGESAGSEHSERVAISSRAKEIAKAREAASSGSDVDEAKVARLRAAIHNGSYDVDADKVADRLVDEHLHTMF